MGNAVWRCLSVPVCTWDATSLQVPASLRTATSGEYTHTQARMHKPIHTHTQILSVISTVYVAMAPGNAPMRAVLVRQLTDLNMKQSKTQI